MQTQAPTAPTLPKLARPSISPEKLAFLVVLLAIIGVSLVLRFSRIEEQRDLAHWQNRLNLIADSRSADVNGWLERYFQELGAVASNPSLQLYLTTLEAPRPAPDAVPPVAPIAPEEPAQATFLKNLLLVTAVKLGFINTAADPLRQVHANIAVPSGTGMAIVDNSGKVLVGTDGLPVLDANVMARMAALPQGRPGFIDMYAVENGERRIGFVFPIFPIQGDTGASDQLGRLVAIRAVGDDFFKLLQQPGITEKSLEAILVRKEGDNAVYLTQAKDGKDLSARYRLSTQSLDAAYALSDPGSFSADKVDRQSQPVLMTSRPVARVPWALLLHIDRDQALAESTNWRQKTEFIMFFALLALIGGIVAAWWYGTSQRAIMLSEQTGRLAAHSLAQEKMLRLVTDNQPEPLFITDSKNVLHFANARFAERFRIKVGDVAGKDLTALMGTAAAAEYAETNSQALRTHKTVSRTHKMGEGEEARILRSEHIPLSHIPLDSLPVPSPGVLVVDQDVTEIVSERERRERTLNQLISTLVRIVDARDPNAANHSSNVALVAREVAESLGVDPALARTAETAGNLMNLGKIAVSSTILTKSKALQEDEIQVIRDSLHKTVAILHGIEFDGPVLETLAQASERYDGTGPLGLKGEHILITARIIAAANSFIGMVSQRSYRAPLTIEQATAQLMQNIDTQFDRHVVVALINFVVNHGGKARLKL